MRKGCVRFKKLDDLALGAVDRTATRVSVEKHMANYRAARALLAKENSKLLNSSRAMSTVTRFDYQVTPLSSCGVFPRAFCDKALAK